MLTERVSLLNSLTGYPATLRDLVLRGRLNPFCSYAPRGAAWQLLAGEGPEELLSGPAGTGKSRACLEKLNLLACNYPGMRGLIVRKTRESLTESALLTFERDVLGVANPICQGAKRESRHSYRYANGSELIAGGLRTSGRDTTEKVMSTDYDVIYVQEAIELSEDEWERLTTRLRSGVVPFQQLVGDTNPGSPAHWLKRRCDRHATRLRESRHADNPLLWDAVTQDWTPFGRVYIARLDALTGARKLRLRHGLWVQAEGIIFEGYDPAVHLVDRFAIPAEWTRFRVVDFGYTNPFVCQWWAEDPDGRLYRYRELYHTRRTVRVHAEQIKRLSAGEQISATICDHDAEDAATLAENGIPTTRADKRVSVGLQAVQERLQVAGDGRPRLYLLRDSLVETDPWLEEHKLPLCSEQEIEGYVWANRQTKEEPVKENDHGMDTIRYLVMHVDGGISGRIGY